MTTRVLIDAHAGWPVKVEAVDQNHEGVHKSVIGTVEPFTEQYFYVFDTQQLLITEMSREKKF